MRLLLSSSRQPYRRAGLKIGPKHAPTELRPGDVSAEAMTTVLRDPEIAVAWRAEDGGPTIKVSADERELVLEELLILMEAEGARVANIQLQRPEGAEANAEGAAAPDAEAEAKAADAMFTITGAAAADPQGTGTSSAEEPEQSRETADEEAGDRSAASDEGKQPEGTSPLPVADTDTAREPSQPAGEEAASPAAEAPRGPKRSARKR